MDLLIATANAGKAREFREMLSGGGGQVTIRDLSDFGPPMPVVAETGSTFRANACLKAVGYARASGLWALADDSGLEVDALAGSPGVHSARWAQLQGTGGGDADNNATLLKQLESVPDDHRSARFVCVLALADRQGQVILTASDTIEGRILREPRGSNGFGYDPLFCIAGSDLTTAQLEPARKHEISHRGKALRRLRALMARAGLR